MTHSDAGKRCGPFFFDHMVLKGKSGEVSGPEDEPELPCRHCSTCGQEERHPQLARYGLGIPHSLDSSLFTTYHALSIEDFDRMLRHFSVDDSVRQALLPGTRIGNPVLKLLTRPYDFVFKGITMFVSERTLDCVRARGIRVDAIPLKVTYSKKGGSLLSYYYITPHIGYLMDPEWMKLEKDQCWCCQNWCLKPGLGFPRIVRMSKAHVIKSSWPEGIGVVYSRDISATFYSPDFVEACRDAKLTGIGFDQVSWV